jgi:ribosomal protein S18 acetylase RimI-like enzyme
LWYVIVADGHDVGTVWVEHIASPSEGRLGVFLGDPADLSRGIGQAAVRLAVRDYQTAFPADPVTLHVRASNDLAMGCYRAVGFEVVDSGEKVLSSGERISFQTMALSPTSHAHRHA